MKVKEEFVDGEGDTFYIKTTHNLDPVLDRVSRLKSAGHVGMGESRHVGSIPMFLIDLWAKEAGVKWGSEEHREFVKKKILSGEYNKLRPWEGTY
jgi:hypothetical protein